MCDGEEMLRSIIDFHQDQESHWIAELDCGHHQHTRHDPPFFPRPWVLTEEGRRKHQGTALNCVRCDRQEFPENFVAYRKTPIFNQVSIPDGLTRNHSTKKGVWALIHILKGRVLYQMDEPFNSVQNLDAGQKGIILPEVLHSVQPENDSEFFVEFWKKEETKLT